MSESSKHIELVQIAYKYIKEFAPPESSCLTFVDLPDSKEKPRPNIDGYVPDVIYSYQDVLIIGEAKTTSDIESKRSLKQLSSFIKQCNDHHGTSKLVICVPFHDTARAKSVLAFMQYSLGIQVDYEIICECDR